MHEKKLPDWILREEHYEPKSDRDDFISRSLLRLIGVLSALQIQGRREAPGLVSAGAALWLTFITVLCCAASHTASFLLCVLAGELVIMCFMSGAAIVRLLCRSLTATGFGVFLILPAFFLGQGTLIFLLPAKTFLTVTALGLLTHFFPWHRLTAALRAYHVPEVVIFVLDTTLRYIVLLGRQAKELLTALNLRSVGYNPHKNKAIAGVLGVTFLRSQEMSREMYQAMCCRCFTGEYEYFSSGNGALKPGDVVCFLLAFVCAVLFFRLEVI